MFKYPPRSRVASTAGPALQGQPDTGTRLCQTGQGLGHASAEAPAGKKLHRLGSCSMQAGSLGRKV